MLARLPVLLIALIVLGIGFGAVERLWPSLRGQKRLRPGMLTDITYFFFSGTLGRLLSGVFAFIVIVIAARILGVGPTGEQLRGLAARETSISRWPVGLQLIAFIVLADFLSYWQHRAFHSFGRLWRIHAVHHSSTTLDWLSAARVHPLNDALSTAIVATPLLLLGFSARTLGAYLPLLTLYAIALHANVSWSYGPLRYVIASPAFHRWHHSNAPEAIDKNFAGLLPLWDALFGTLYLPKDLRATSFGVSGEPVPGSFLPQLVYPFRPPARTAA